MSAKNFASYGDLETILTGFANAIKSKPSTLYADNPIGSIVPYGGATAPSGWLFCNGIQVSKTTYSELYAVIGDSFKGDKADPTSGNFYLPDLREVTLKGVGTNYAYSITDHATVNNVGGFMNDRVQDHSHRTRLHNLYFQVGGDNQAVVTDDGSSGIGSVEEIVSGRHGATTEVKAVGVNYIIKAEHTPVPADFIAAMEEAVEDALETVVTKYDYVIPYAEQDTLEKAVKELIRRIASDSSIPNRSTFNVFLEWQNASIVQVTVAKYNPTWVSVNGSTTDMMFWGGQVVDTWKWHEA